MQRSRRRRLNSLEMLKPLKEELSALDEEIEELNRLLDISCAVNDNMSDDVVSNDLLMPRVPGGFTRIECEVDASSLDIRRTMSALLPQ